MNPKPKATMVEVAVEFSGYILLMYQFYAILLNAIFPWYQL
jgi:hypothetical protein